MHSAHNATLPPQAAECLEEATGERCLAMQLDVRDAAAVDGVVLATLREFGRVDILVNAAAGNFLCPAESLSTNAFRTVMGTTRKAPHALDRR